MMHLFHTRVQLQEFLNEQKRKGLQWGFVPTMGALHAGHISLVERAKAENALVVCSIFVNPTQFNDPADLERYPRTLQADCKLLMQAQCNVVYAPSVEEMYPQQDTRVFTFGPLEQVMEGAFRPGHFNGVAQIVSKLFEHVQPHRAYFGQKDFQQLAIIRAWAKQANAPVQIIGCPTLREPNGLAMSSRNTLLSPQQRAEAGIIYQTLLGVKAGWQAGTEAHTLEAEAMQKLQASGTMHVEYVQIADVETLQPLPNKERQRLAVVCVALKLGSVRLIDNLILQDETY